MTVLRFQTRESTSDNPRPPSLWIGEQKDGAGWGGGEKDEEAAADAAGGVMM